MSENEIEDPSTEPPQEAYVYVEGEEETRYQEEEYDEQAQLVTIKTLFSQLDPAVVKAQGDATGDIGVALRYKEDKELLLVRVLAAQGLASRQVGRTSVDPHVQITILDRDGGDAAKTTVKKNATNPVWNEILVFNVEEWTVEDTRLLLRVYDGSDIIGEVLITLDWSMLEGDPEWFQLQAQRDWSMSGALHVRIHYSHPTTLHVNIASAEGIAGKDSNKLSDPYVRVTLAGKFPVKTTAVIKNTVNPTWSETFDFYIPVQLLKTVTVLLAVYNKNMLTEDDFLGEARISLSEFRHFQEIDSWYPLADLKHVARHRSEWSKGVVEQELREALVAHLAARSPGVIFNCKAPQKDRVVRLSCPKVGQVAKVTISNGRPIIN